MTTVALQRIKTTDGMASHRVSGAVTGASYIVNQLGYVVVDSQDAVSAVAKGNFVYAPWYVTPNNPNSGVATINFGAFPGAVTAQLTVAATAIDASDPNAEVDVWIIPIATADHTADEHSADPPLVNARIVSGQIVINAYPSGRDKPVPPGTPFGQTATSQMPIGNQQPMPYGAWSVAWAFSP